MEKKSDVKVQSLKPAKNQLQNSSSANLQNKNETTGQFGIPVIALFIILAIGLLFIFVYIKRQNQPIPTKNYLSSDTTSKSSPSSKHVFPVKIFDTTIKNNNDEQIKGFPANCQPNFFDPKISKFPKVKETDIPTQLYIIDKFSENAAGVISIDEWREGEKGTVNLSMPYKATIYSFDCVSESDFVIDLSKNGVRQALYTHVNHYAFSDDDKYLYLVNNINNNGNWTLHKRIVEVETKKVFEIPNTECASILDAFWQGDRLLTFTQRSDRSDYKTDICVWDKSANLLHRVGANTAWRAYSRDVLVEDIGLIPYKPDIFYAYTSKDENTCALFLTDLTQNTSLGSIDILDKRNWEGDNLTNAYCDKNNVEFDFSDMTEAEKILRYRTKNEWRTAEFE